jgi:uncharacterized protein (TIGR03066 family)
MRTLLGCMLVLLVACSLTAADDKIDAKLLVGKWSPKNKKEVVVEFAKDGKLTVTVGGDGKELKLEGTYKVDGNKLETAVKFGDDEKKRTITVSKLTETELVGKDEDGKEDTLVKIKAK